MILILLKIGSKTGGFLFSLHLNETQGVLHLVDFWYISAQTTKLATTADNKEMLCSISFSLFCKGLEPNK